MELGKEKNVCAFYVTWESQSSGGTNSLVYIMADYLDTKGGPIAFQSPATSASTGFIAWTIAKEWLQDKSFNNITLYINPINPISGEATRFSGPTVMVTNEPPDYYHQPPTEAPKGRDLYVALPTAFGFIILCVCGGCIINRK
ncbi:hypothetical protein BDZ45DRAFT_672849 [Acephala macrosclerotiorum]|nr:hypothetical protein BDZ45DRAFT_672849 [Acephala macrosclerotiorum]